MSFRFGFEGEMLYLCVLVSDHCLSVCIVCSFISAVYSVHFQKI